MAATDANLPNNITSADPDVINRNLTPIKDTTTNNDWRTTRRAEPDGSDDTNIAVYVAPVVSVVILVALVGFLVYRFKSRVSLSSRPWRGKKFLHRKYADNNTDTTPRNPGNDRNGSALYTIEPDYIKKIYTSQNGNSRVYTADQRHTFHNSAPDIPAEGMALRGFGSNNSVKSDNSELYNCKPPPCPKVNGRDVHLSLDCVDNFSPVSHHADTNSRSLSSDHIEDARWHRPIVGGTKGSSLSSKASSLGRDSGIGESQEMSSNGLSEISLYGCSPGSSEDDEAYESATINPAKLERPRSLPPLHIPSQRAPQDYSPSLTDISDEDIFIDPDPKRHIENLRQRFWAIHQNTYSYQNVSNNLTLACRGPSFAIGIFGKEGGVLQFGDGSGCINLPEDAIVGEQEIFMYSYYENVTRSGHRLLRRVVECGPDGTQFLKPVCVSFTPRVIYYDEVSGRTRNSRSLLNVVCKEATDATWNTPAQKDAFWKADKDLVTIHVTHFTGFTVETVETQPQDSHGTNAQREKAPSNPAQRFPSDARIRVCVFEKVFAGNLGTTRGIFNVCLVNGNREHLKELKQGQERLGFVQALSVPRQLSLSFRHGPVHIEVASTQTCDVQNSNKRQVVNLDEILDEEDGWAVAQREFILTTTPQGTSPLASASPPAAGTFELCLYQGLTPGSTTTICLCVDANKLRKELPELSPLNYDDIIGYLGNIKLAPYNVCQFFPKRLKLDLCVRMENDWWHLAEAARIEANKMDWIEHYCRGKDITPCYLVLDLIEARMISARKDSDEAICELSDMLENTGHETAADQVRVWRRHSARAGSGSRSTQHRSRLIPQTIAELDTIEENQELCSEHASIQDKSVNLRKDSYMRTESDSSDSMRADSSPTSSSIDENIPFNLSAMGLTDTRKFSSVPANGYMVGYVPESSRSQYEEALLRFKRGTGSGRHRSNDSGIASDTESHPSSPLHFDNDDRLVTSV